MAATKRGLPPEHDEAIDSLTGSGRTPPKTPPTTPPQTRPPSTREERGEEEQARTTDHSGQLSTKVAVSSPATPNRTGRPKGPPKKREHFSLRIETLQTIEATFRRGRHPLTGAYFRSASEVVDFLVETSTAPWIIRDATEPAA